MEILVTGGCGYVGTILVGKLIGHGYRVTVVDNVWFGNYLRDDPNLTLIRKDIREISELPNKKYWAIIHLAGIANDPCVELNPRLSWEVNTLATMRLAEAAKRAGVELFIYASSGSVYGVRKESQVTEELSPEPLSEYNKTKMASERIVLSYKDDMRVVCLRPATVCGFSPRMRFDVVVNMLTIQALENKKITVLGGEQYRPHIHIQDMTELYLFCLRYSERVSGEVFNAGFENMKVMDLAEFIALKAGGIEIEVKPSNDPRSYRMNSAKIMGIGFIPKFSVEDAVEDLIYQYNHNGLRSCDRNYNILWMKKNVLGENS